MALPMVRVEIVRAACCIAGLDGNVCARERPMLEKLAEFAGIGEVSLNARIARADEDQNFYQEQVNNLKSDPAATITSLFCVACADGELLASQRIILQHFADVLGLDQKQFDEILEAAQKKTQGQ